MCRVQLCERRWLRLQSDPPPLPRAPPHLLRTRRPPPRPKIPRRRQTPPGFSEVAQPLLAVHGVNRTTDKTTTTKTLSQCRSVLGDAATGTGKSACATSAPRSTISNLLAERTIVL